MSFVLGSVMLPGGRSRSQSAGRTHGLRVAALLAGFAFVASPVRAEVLTFTAEIDRFSMVNVHADTTFVPSPGAVVLDVPTNAQGDILDGPAELLALDLSIGWTAALGTMRTAQVVGVSTIDYAHRTGASVEGGVLSVDMSQVPEQGWPVPTFGRLETTVCTGPCGFFREGVTFYLDPLEIRLAFDGVGYEGFLPVRFNGGVMGADLYFSGTRTLASGAGPEPGALALLALGLGALGLIRRR